MLCYGMNMTTVEAVADTQKVDPNRMEWMKHKAKEAFEAADADKSKSLDIKEARVMLVRSSPSRLRQLTRVFGRRIFATWMRGPRLLE